MTDIGQINTLIIKGKAVFSKAPTEHVEKNVQRNKRAGENIYPTGALMRSVAGISAPISFKGKLPKDKETEEIKTYLNSLPITGKVMKYYDTPDGEISHTDGLITAMKRNDVEASNVEMLLELVEKKKVHYSALLCLCKNGIMSDEFESDLDLLYECYTEKKDIKETFVPTLKAAEEGIEKRKTGEVFGVEGKENIYIMTGEGKPEELKISRDTYLKLFPPLERYATYQGDTGDCYMLSAIETMNSNAATRVSLLRCFSEEGDKLKVQLPGGNYKLECEKVKLPVEITDYKQNYSTGSRGFKLLEHAYGEEVRTSLNKEAIEILTDKSVNAKKRRHRKLYEKQLNELKAELASEPNDIVIDTRLAKLVPAFDEECGIQFEHLSDKKTEFKRPCDYYLGNGGREEWVFEKFGFSDAERMYDLNTVNKSKASELLTDPEKSKSYLFTASTHTAGVGELPADEDYGVYTGHSFSVKPRVDKNGKPVLHISNPWNQSHNVVMSFEKFTELFDTLICTKI